MKKVFSVLAIAAFSLTFAQETPKKSCCATSNSKKECKMGDKKMAKSCDMKDHKNCKTDCSTATKKSSAKKAA